MRFRLIVAAALVLFVACLFSGTKPVMESQAFVEAGDVAAIEENRVVEAIPLYQKAARSDTFSPIPHERTAELEFLLWQRHAADQEEPALFQRVVDASQKAISRDPFNPHGYAKLARRYLDRFRRTQSPRDAEHAIAFYEHAVRQYPSSVQIVSEFAQALAACARAEQAKEAAQHALTLDDLNHRLGHSDKYLAPETVRLLRELADGAREKPRKR